MSWTPLAERFSTLPLILAGPMLRRAEPRAVTVWLALKASCRVIRSTYAGNAGGKLVQRFEGTRQTVRRGYHLHIVGLTASTANDYEQLNTGKLEYYLLLFYPDQASEHDGLERF